MVQCRFSDGFRYEDAARLAQMCGTSPEGGKIRAVDKLRTGEARAIRAALGL